MRLIDKIFNCFNIICLRKNKLKKLQNYDYNLRKETEIFKKSKQIRSNVMLNNNKAINSNSNLNLKDNETVNKAFKYINNKYFNEKNLQSLKNSNYSNIKIKFKEFVDEKDVDVWAKDNYSDWKKQLNWKKLEDNRSSGKSSAIELYRGDGYNYINGLLRGNICFNKGDHETYYKDLGIELAKDIKAAGPLSENIIVYRSVDDETFEMILDELIRENKFIEKGFLSTTLLKEKVMSGEERYVCDNRCILKIYVKKGTRGAYTSIFFDTIGEYEMTFLNNSVLKLKSPPYVYINNNKIILECNFESYYDKNNIRYF